MSSASSTTSTWRSSTPSDTIIEIVTYDSTTIHNTIAMADTFRTIGYPATKVHYLVNRADSPGGIDPSDLERALGRVPEHRVVSDGHARRPVEQRGRAVRPGRTRRGDQPGHHARRRRAARRRSGRRRGRARDGAEHGDVRPAPHRRLRLGGRRPDGPARDPPPLARTNRRSTSATTPAPRTASAPTTRSWPSRRSRSTPSSSATSRPSSSPATPRRRSRSATSGAATTCRSSASSGRARRRRPWRPATAGSA